MNRSPRPRDLIALRYIDLDRFKAVNDKSGHEAGGEVLKTVANRLGIFLRGGDTVARIGGDEFAVLLETVEDEASVLRVASRITTLLGRPIPLGDSEIEIGGSVGIALSTPDACTPEELVRQADLAMYEAKRVGGHRYHVYRPELEENYATFPIQMESDLWRAPCARPTRVLQQPPRRRSPSTRP